MHTENFFDIKYKKIIELIKDDNIQFSNIVMKLNGRNHNDKMI